MRQPHPGLPWPTIDPDALSRTSSDLRRLAVTIENEIRDWRFRPVDWNGRSADAHGVELDQIRARAASLPEAAANAGAAIEWLERGVCSAHHDIRRLAETVRAAESTAASRRAAADRAARAAAAAPGLGPASLAESERLRHTALVARHRAEDAEREARFALRRAIDAASRIVEAIDRQDRLLANRLDSLLTAALGPRIEQSGFGSPISTRADDRTWILDQITATTTSIRRHVDALAVAISAIEAVPWAERTWWESMALVHLTETYELHQRFLSPGRQMLDWEPVDDGRAIEVFGDLATARHIAVVVPGIMNTIENFDDQLGRNAKDLWVGTSAFDRRTAVVAWLGYDTPELLNAVSKGRAIEYEAELRSFVASLPRDAHVTVVAHSYGTVLAAESAARGLAADDLVLLGSPGTRLDHAADADLEPDAQVFAGVSDTDWIVGRSGWGSVLCPEMIVDTAWLTGLRLLANPVTGPLSWVTDSCKTDSDGDIKGLSHGLNPAHEDFGAVEISTADVDGHSSYFDPNSTSLDAVARIVTGTHPDQH
jgi:hypothetical protein